MSRYYREVDGEIVLTFGKHRGELLEDIADDDQEYLVWVLGEFASGKDFDEELAVEIESALTARGVKIDELF